MATIRTFIAIELSPEVLKQIGGLQDRLKREVPSGLVRWVRPQGIHLTLKFLGDIPPEKVDPIAKALCEACAPHAPFALAVEGTGCFPDPIRPRVLWVGVKEPSGALARLQRDVERAVRPLGFPPEGHPFRPHLTLGRVKGRGRDTIQVLGETISQAAFTAGEMDVTSAHLIRSDLLPGGAVYTELASAPLGGRQAEPR